MARQQPTGNLRAWHVPAIANIAAPTTTEINAGFDFTGYLKRDGLSTPKSGQTASASDVASRFNKTSPGTYGGDPMEISLYRDDSVDTAWTTFVPPSAASPAGTSGFVVIRRFGGATVAIASTNKVEVWPHSVISSEMQQIAENENAFFKVLLAITAEPNDRAVVA
jgi:hypothetical protein